MKGKTRGKWKRKGDTGKLQKYMVSVDEFVQRKVGGGGGGETEEDHGIRIVKNKSRKELRKEKRKSKKIKKKHYYEGNKHQFQINSSTSQGDDNEIATTVKKDKNNTAKHDKKATLNESEIKNSKEAGGQTSEAKNKSKETVSKLGAKKKSKLQEHRKQALLEANAAEDKEIKKLERYLGLNKRKNKKTLPQSFAADGLDYILGALEPGLSASGMYESDEDMEVAEAKDKLKMLEGSDSDEQDDSAEDVVDDNLDSDRDSDEMDVMTGDEEEEDDDEDDEEDASAEEDSAEASECEDEEHVKEEPGGDAKELADEEEDNASQTVSEMYCSFPHAAL